MHLLRYSHLGSMYILTQWYDKNDASLDIVVLLALDKVTGTLGLWRSFGVKGVKSDKGGLKAYLQV